MHSIKREGPAIIAIQHWTDEWLQESDGIQRCKKTRDALKEISRDGKKRTLFVESTQEAISIALSRKPKTPSEVIFAKNINRIHDPFAEAIRIAHNKDYKIVALDTSSTEVFFQRLGIAYSLASDSRREELLKPMSYVNKNIREKCMAKRLARHKPTSDDIIIMRPNHVEGFLAYAGFKPKSINWLDRPTKRGPHDVWRLKGRELRNFLKERKLKRKERQRIAFARKRI